jgi:hypothetical protein
MTAAMLTPTTLQDAAEGALANPTSFVFAPQGAFPLLHEILRAAVSKAGRSPEERRARYEAAAILLDRFTDMGPTYLLGSLPLVAAFAQERGNGWAVPAAFAKFAPIFRAAGAIP